MAPQYGLREPRQVLQPEQPQVLQPEQPQALQTTAPELPPPVRLAN